MSKKEKKKRIRKLRFMNEKLLMEILIRYS